VSVIQAWRIQVKLGRSGRYEVNYQARDRMGINVFVHDDGKTGQPIMEKVETAFRDAETLFARQQAETAIEDSPDIPAEHGK
jgi:hypothetical protein